MFERPCLNGRFGKTVRETVYRNCQALCTMGRKTWRHGVPHEQNCAICGDNLAKINMIYHFYAPGQLEYSSIDKMAKYDRSTFHNYVAFLAGELAPGTRHPHHDSESSSCYHDAFLPWGHYHNNIVLFYHDSPITRSHFMDPTDRAIKGFYCTDIDSIVLDCRNSVAYSLEIVQTCAKPSILNSLAPGRWKIHWKVIFECNFCRCICTYSNENGLHWMP